MYNFLVEVVFLCLRFFICIYFLVLDLRVFVVYYVILGKYVFLFIIKFLEENIGIRYLFIDI